MPRFFCDKHNIFENKIIIENEDAHHMERVLRMKIGEMVTICDKQGSDYSCKIAEFNDKNAVLEIITCVKNDTEPSVDITLYQALPKSDKLEFIIQKAVELGVNTIVPVQTKFCIAKADKDFAKKLVRYNKIAFEAAKQCGRGIIPEVLSIISFDQAVKDSCENKVLYYEHGGQLTEEIIVPSSRAVSIYIGSEGGFCESEVQKAVESGAKIGSLGKLILRCETAPIVALSLILNATKNM